jgi:hypothetical protein
MDQLEAQRRSENWTTNGREAAAAVPSYKVARVTKVFDEVTKTCGNR